VEVYGKKSHDGLDSESGRHSESFYDPKSSSLLHFPEDVEVVIYRYFVVVPQRESIKHNG